MRKFIAQKPVNINISNRPIDKPWLKIGETATVIKHLIGNPNHGYDLMLVERDKDGQRIEVYRHSLLEFGYFP